MLLDGLASDIQVIQRPNLGDKDNPKPNRQWIARLNAAAFARLIEDPYVFVECEIRYADKPNVPVGLSRDDIKRDVSIQCKYDLSLGCKPLSDWHAIVCGVAGLNVMTVAPEQAGLDPRDHIPLPVVKSGSNHCHANFYPTVSAFHVELTVDPEQEITPEDLDTFKLSATLDPVGYVEELNSSRFHFHAVGGEKDTPVKIVWPDSRIFAMTYLYSDISGVDPLLTQVCSTGLCPGPGGGGNRICNSSGTLTTWVAPPLPTA